MIFLTHSSRGKEGYDPSKVSLFGTDEPAANGGQPGTRGREGYDPSKVSLFGTDEPAANNGQPGKVWLPKGRPCLLVIVVVLVAVVVCVYTRRQREARGRKLGFIIRVHIQMTCRYYAAFGRPSLVSPLVVVVAVVAVVTTQAPAARKDTTLPWYPCLGLTKNPSTMESRETEDAKDTIHPTCLFLATKKSKRASVIVCLCKRARARVCRNHWDLAPSWSYG